MNIVQGTRDRMSIARAKTMQMGAGGAAAFTPLSLSPLVWSKADAGTFKDEARSVSASADADAVLGWTDQGGSGNHFSDAMGVTLKLNIQNGLPVLRGNGTDQRLSTGSITHNIGTGDFYYAVVIVPRGLTGAYDAICSIGTALAGLYVRTNSNTIFGAYIGTDKLFDTVPVVGTAYVLELFRESGTLKFTVNGTQDATTFSVGDSIGAGKFWAFDDNGSGHAQIDIGEIMFCNALPSSTLRAQNRAYLGARWGITVS